MHHPQHLQHHQPAESGGDESRTSMNGFKAYLTDTWISLNAWLVLTLAGSLCSQRSFTANRPLKACNQRSPVSTNTPVCLGAAADGKRLLASSTGCTRPSCGSAEKQALTLLYWQPQQPKWPPVLSFCTMYVIGCSTQQQLRPTLVTGGTGSCVGAPSLSGSRLILPSARRSVEAAETLLWPMGMQSSAAAAAREPLAHPQCHYGASLGTAAECLILMNSEQANFAAPARQPWMACVSLFQVTPTSADLIGFIICIVLCARIQYKAVQCSIMCMHMSGKLHKASQYKGSSALRIYD